MPASAHRARPSPGRLARSLKHHRRWLGDLVHPRDPALAPTSVRRLTTMALGLPPYLALQAVHGLGLATDRLLYPALATQAVDDALFIVGVPRSGTTYLHRLLAGDTETPSGWASCTTWEALLAPSLSERALWRRLLAAHDAVGAPLSRLSAVTDRLLGGDFDVVHELGLRAPEEDYLALLPVAGCFLAALAFPADDGLWRLGRMDDMPAAERELLLDSYAGLLRRQRLAAGGRPLLSKNAAFASWTGALAERFPRSRFLICIREPAEALSSQLSAIEPALRLFGVDPERRHIPARFAALYAHWFRHLADQAEAHPQRMAVIEQSQLARAPGRPLQQALQRIGLPADAALQARLAQADRNSAGHRSRHRHRLDLGAGGVQAPLRAMQQDYRRLRALTDHPLQRAS